MPSPFDPSQWFGATGDPDLSYTSITEPNPSGESFVGEFEYVGPSTANPYIGDEVSFSIGDDIYMGFLCKPIGVDFIRCTIQERPSGTNAYNFYVDLNSGTVSNESGPEDGSYKITILANGWFLIEARISNAQATMYRPVTWLQYPSGPVSIGAKLKMQAAFFGKADDWPANVMPTL